MKRILILILMVTLTASVFAYNLDDVQASFQTFADETANALPLAASLGLNWNDAYSGNFPHFGAGLTMGAVFLPSEAFEEVYALTGNTSLGDFSNLGIPLPVYSIDGRLGIPVLPLDVGLKFGILSPDMLSLDKISVGFKMVGGDVRWAVLEGNAILPEVSVGFGYTWLNGDITAPIADQSVDISSSGAGTALTLEDSDMNFNWSTNVMDFKAQVSKKLLILNLSAGAGYSYGFSTAGGGLTAATVKVDGTTINDSQIAQIEDATGLSVDPDGLNVVSEVNGGAFRLFGGVGLNVLLLKIDLGLVYGLPSQSLGMSANARIQY